ncbi:39S ribosomal protein L47, mitochondrial-like [Gracilinanus agilis]|uniref:39S ribosomal protein L47, mitochondrial-like n=1 Tax=Gracilinanus agilis TaxID=191870 RepID=UPI001CFC7E6C|nr:39S ribosomal protein L47, mitochondrial-like [Gracilinanus agilis]
MGLRKPLSISDKDSISWTSCNYKALINMIYFYPYQQRQGNTCDKESIGIEEGGPHKKVPIWIEYKVPSLVFKALHNPASTYLSYLLIPYFLPALAASPGFTFSLLNKIRANINPLHQYKLIHTTLSKKGLEEFFDDPKNWGAETVKSGAARTHEQLRCKSNEDLHKLWYVLLKERNMLLMLQQETKRQRLLMQSPEQLEKVTEFMDALDKVVQERDDALRLLQTSQEKPRPGDFRKDIFGHIIWYKYKQWPVIPWHLNKRYNRNKYFTMLFVDQFVRLRLAKYLHSEAKKKSLKRRKEKILQRKFPHMSAEAPN